MSGTVHETLDERIDRVAAAITAVPADPGFSERLAPRLAEHGREWSSRWVFASAAAAAVLVMAVVVSDWREQGGAPPRSVVGSSPTSAPSQLDAPPVVAAEEPMVEQAVSAMAPAPEYLESEVERPPAIAALPAPEGIGVATLQLDALHVTPVDVGEIDVASLEIPEIGALEEPKE